MSLPKRCGWFGLLLLISALTVSAVPTKKYAKMNAGLRFILESDAHRFAFPSPSREMQKPLDFKKVPVLIKYSGTRQQLTQAGALVQAQIGNIFSAQVTPASLRHLLNDEQVEFVQGEIYHQNLCDVSTREIKAITARNQYRVSGKGVLIGIIDTGIDWRHEDFRNPDGTTRIKYILDFSVPGDLNGDQIPDGPDVYGGTLYTESQINQALQGLVEIKSLDRVGHGSHVAGIAAGNGLGTDNNVPAGTYTGVAPEADLIIVKASLRDTEGYQPVNLVNSMAFIDSIASLLGQPYVINLSIGGQEGPHDGTNLEELAVDNLTGPGKPGKVAFIAAGNDGDSEIHVAGELSSAQSSKVVTFNIPKYTPQAQAKNDYVLFDIWYDAAANISITLTSPGGKTFGPVNAFGVVGDDTNEGALYIENALHGPSQQNGDKEILLQIYDYTAEKPPAQGKWTLTFRGTYGTFHLWMYANECQAKITSGVDESHLISIPGTAKQAITVGSYVTKKSWTDYYGSSWQYPWTISALSTYSSPGPTRDERQKPDLVAPGQEIAATFSRDASPASEQSVFAPPEGQKEKLFIMPDGKHGLLHGTSMAAPHGTGTAALLLELNPNLDASQIKEILINSARQDPFTGSVPNYQFGHGKLDVQAALKKIEEAVLFPAPIQLKAVDLDSGIKLTWQPPRQTNLTTTGQNSISSLIEMSPLTTAVRPLVTLDKKLPGDAGLGSNHSELSELIGYRIYRSTDALQNFRVLLTKISASEFFDQAVENGKEYWYYVTALYENPKGESFPSNKASAIRGSQLNRPFEINYDNGVAMAYGRFGAGHIMALKFDLNEAVNEYHLNAVRFLGVNFQEKNPTGSSGFRIHVYNTTIDDKIGKQLAESEIFTATKTELYPNWTEFDARNLRIVRQREEAIVIGVEFVNGDSATVLLDSSKAIERNRAFYYLKTRWDEHYDFWQNAAGLGYPMIRAVFTARAPSDTLPTPTDAEKNIFLANFPNPFDLRTTISFYVLETKPVTLTIYDVLGRQMRTLLNQEINGGSQPIRISWNGTAENGMMVPNGVYFIVVKIDQQQDVRKVLVLR